MGLTTSLQTGLTGLAANSTMIDVTGNNIANVNTNGFKASRVSFETQIAETRRSGSAPSAELGGTNPAQIGAASMSPPSPPTSPAGRSPSPAITPTSPSRATASSSSTTPGPSASPATATSP